MKLVLISFLPVFLFLFSSCGSKQEDVKINKFSGNNETVVDSQTKSGTVSPNRNELTSGGESSNVLSTGDAKNHVNENAIVRGYVADVVEREKVAYLNFDKKYPKNSFSAVIFDDKFSEVGELNIYKNQNVEIKGTITIYKDKPQIIITSKNQIRLIK